MGEYHIDETIRLYLLRVHGINTGTLVTTTGTQTLTNKTLTAPAINGTVGTTGLIIGADAAALVSFHGAAAVDQAAAIADAGIGTEITTINAILAFLRERGDIAT